MTRIREIDGTIKPAIPYLEYSSASYYGLVANTWTPLAWDNYDIITSDFTNKREDEEADYVVVETTGLYRIDLQISFHGGASGRVRSRILVNDVYINKSHIFTFHSNNLGAVLNSSVTVYLKKDDIISSEFMVSNINIVPQEDGSLFRISFIPMLGWNNKQAGTSIYRGIRR